jgi:hypothetical protein
VLPLTILHIMCLFCMSKEAGVENELSGEVVIERIRGEHGSRVDNVLSCKGYKGYKGYKVFGSAASSTACVIDEEGKFACA